MTTDKLDNLGWEEVGWRMKDNEGYQEMEDGGGEDTTRENQHPQTFDEGGFGYSISEPQFVLCTLRTLEMLIP